jgi:hypothetical protein
VTNKEGEGAAQRLAAQQDHAVRRMRTAAIQTASTRPARDPQVVDSTGGGPPRDRTRDTLIKVRCSTTEPLTRRNRFDIYNLQQVVCVFG